MKYVRSVEPGGCVVKGPTLGGTTECRGQIASGQWKSSRAVSVAVQQKQICKNTQPDRGTAHRQGANRWDEVLAISRHVRGNWDSSSSNTKLTSEFSWLENEAG